MLFSDDTERVDDEEVGESWDDESDFDDAKDDAEGDENEEKDEKSDTDSDENSDEEDEDKEKKTRKPVDKSAIVQKQKYRAKLREAQAELKRLKETSDPKDGDKERAAKEYLRNTILDVLKGMKEAETEAAEAEAEAFEEELDEVLEETTDFSEKQLRAISKEYEVSPQKALKILQREAKLKGKEKPKVPTPRRGTPTVEKAKEDKNAPKGLDGINRSLKALIRSGKI